MMIRWLSQLAAACMLLTLAGCAMPGLFKLSKDDFPKTGSQNPVIRILGMWQAAEGMAMNRTLRGFSAQILFFSQNSDLAAQVDGDVRIYVFDDQGSPEDQAMPFHEFNYTAAAWNTLMGKGALGATYAVSVPYSRPGNHEAKCALRIRYTPKGGSPVYSDMVNVVLPGTKRPKDTASPATTDDDSAVKGPEARNESPDLLDQNVSKRKPPHVRGIATTIPTPQEIQKQLHAQKTVPAAELNGKERRRIMREATVRLEVGEDGSNVSLAGYEEPETNVVPVEEVSSGRRLRKPQPDAEDSLDADDGEETPASVKPNARPPKTHILDDEERVSAESRRKSVGQA